MALVPGHVDALGNLVVTDASGQPRDDITIAIQENYDPENPEPLRLEAADLAPISGTLVGDAIEGATSAQWTALASTGAQPHRGRWRVYARIEADPNAADAIDSLVRFSYRIGDGEFSTTDRPVVTPHVAGELIELDLGIVNIVEQEGTHSWSGQVEFKAASTGLTATTGLTLRLRELLFMPATRWSRARAPAVLSTPTALEARDGFDQSAGDLTGKALPDGSGNWAGAGDADDFDVGLGAASRSAVSDTGGLNALQNGRFGLAPPTLSNTAVEVNLEQSAVLDNTGSPNVGVVARYVDINNWLVGMALRFKNPASAAQTGTYLYVYKRVAGATPVQLRVARARPIAEANVLDTIRLAAFDSGDWELWFYRGNGSPYVIGGHDADLATGGALATGKVGMFDWHPDATAVTRIYDSFAVWAPEADHVIHPNQSLRIDHRSAEREDAAGTRWGDVPVYTGRRLFVPPATRNGNVSRLVVKADRNDLTQLPVGGPTPTEDPALVWALDSDTAATDLSPNGRDGTGAGGITIGGAAGPTGLNGATEFDGSDDYITSAYSPFGDAQPFTVAGWAWRDAAATGQRAFCGGDGGADAPGFYTTASHEVRFRIRTSDGNAVSAAAWGVGTIPGSDVWVHVALTFDPTTDTVELFIDRASKGAVTGLTQTFSGAGNFKLGAMTTGATSAWDGRLAYWAIYERILTMGEIEGLPPSGLTATLSVTPRVLLTA